MATAKPFEELHIPRKETPEVVGKYRVFGAGGECVEVAANTVLEALEASGVKDPVKVERALLSSLGIISRDKLTKLIHSEAAAAVVATAAVAAEAAAPAAT